jgi:hypothetical protein
VSGGTVEALVEESRSAWNERRQRMPADQLAGQAFWVSRNHQALFDDIAHYRCYERFELEEFTQLFADVERQLGESLLAVASSLDPFGVSPGPWMDVGMGPLMLWELSRTDRLPVALSDAIGLALRALGHRQHPDGWWPSVSPTERNERYPDTMATAAAAVAIIKLSLCYATTTLIRSVLSGPIVLTPFM